MRLSEALRNLIATKSKTYEFWYIEYNRDDEWG
jgi:hypothetical protein